MNMRSSWVLVLVILIRSAMGKLLFIGGYSEEIVLAALDDYQVLSRISSFPSGKNPSILALHPHCRILYAANEIKQGAVQAFAFDDSGNVSSLCAPIDTQGADPAFITVDPTGNWLFFANYNGGSYGVAKIDPSSGELLGGQPVSLIKAPYLRRKPANPGRQEAPHPHQIITDSQGKLIFVCDLGNDEIHIRELNSLTGELHRLRGKEDHVDVPRGSGPRHMIFSPDNRFAYVLNELANNIQLFAYDPGHGCGGLRYLEKMWSTLPVEAHGHLMTAAEVAISPDGRFLYASNRGGEQDTIAVFSVDCESGDLELLGHDQVGGSWPRHFSLDPSGEMVVVALEKSNKVTLLKRDSVTGRLSLLPSCLEGVTAPTYIQFLPTG